MIYLNDIDKGAQAWLAQLYPGAVIDGRSIADVKSDDVVGFSRVHFFAGIGGWEYALHLAGVPADMPIWTGSCPCQPFSVAGKGGGEADERHLWPEMRRLISECLPPIVLGEQVASKAGREWLSRVRADLEALGYAVGSADLCAAGEGAPHIRQRLYWGAIRLSDLRGSRLEERPEQSSRRQCQAVERGGDACGLPLPDRQRRDGLDPLLRPRGPGETDSEAARSGPSGWLSVSNGRQCNGFAGGEGCDFDRKASGWLKGDCESECYCKSSGTSRRVGYASSHDEQRDPVPRAHWEGLEDRGSGGTGGLANDSIDGWRQGSQNGRGGTPGGDSENERVRPLHGSATGFWSDYDILPFTDRKARRIEPGTFPLVNGVSRRVGYSGDPRLPEYAKATAEARKMRLKGYGNAIVPQVAATFIRAFLESVQEANL